MTTTDSFEITFNQQSIYCSCTHTSEETFYTVNLPEHVVELVFDYDQYNNACWLINGESNGLASALGEAIEAAHH